MESIAADGAAASGSDGPGAGAVPRDDEPAPTAILCMNCDVRARCLGGAAAEAGTSHLRSILAGRRSLRRMEVLYEPGDAFEHVYAVRTGTLKSVVQGGGEEQVRGFHFPGELVGVDGMADGSHRVALVALEDAQLCAVRFVPRGGDCDGARALLSRLWDMMSCELVRERTHHALLATLPASRRVRAFLASVAARMRRRRDTPDLPPALARADVASYLGLPTDVVGAALEGAVPRP
jgi:CRP/FNR family transcriptional regulator